MQKFRLHLLPLIIVAVMAVPSLLAGHRNWKEPPRCINYIGRHLGIGWSDGYHSGGRNSWTRSYSSVYSQSRTYPTNYQYQTMPPVQPEEVLNYDKLPVPQTTLRRLPPVTR